MKIRTFAVYFIQATLLIFLAGCTGKKTQDKPQNIILMIGDGMGVSHITAGMTANGGSLNLEKFNHVGFQKTNSANRYITDSGASATAMATGQKTNNSAISVDTLGNSLKSIVEYSEEAGLYTGLLATSTITHATPAAFAAHNPDRGKYEEIAVDFLTSGLELIIGGGKAHFQNREDGRNLLQELESTGYFIGEGLDDIGTDTELPVVVLTDSLAMPPANQGRGDLLPRCTETSIQLLSKNPLGFFLMVEASQIDWAAHDNDTEYLVSEMIDFDESIGIALDFAMQDGNTLVIVTGDHETGGFSVESGNFETGEVVGDFTSDGHTGTMIPVFAYGPGSGLFAGIYENTAIFDKMMTLLDLK